MSKTGIIISDLHCGSRFGLTPPGWQLQEVENDIDKHNKIAYLQQQGWKWYSDNIKSIGKVDYLLSLGDLIDGQGWKDKGCGMITTNRNEQTEIAIECISQVKYKTFRMVYGTGYHVSSDGEEWEALISERLDGHGGIHSFLEINGVVFNLKHKVGRSTKPEGKGPLIHKAKLWELMWKEYKNFPSSDVLLRGHVHYFYELGDSRAKMITCPSLKMLGEAYGSKNFDDIVDFGFLYFEITNRGAFHVEKFICEMEFARPTVEAI